MKPKMLGLKLLRHQALPASDLLSVLLLVVALEQVEQVVVDVALQLLVFLRL